LERYNALIRTIKRNLNFTYLEFLVRAVIAPDRTRCWN